jgi:hypothetical protein
MAHFLLILESADPPRSLLVKKPSARLLQLAFSRIASGLAGRLLLCGTILTEIEAVTLIALMNYSRINRRTTSCIANGLGNDRN